jgi:hypothetical protein
MLVFSTFPITKSIDFLILIDYSIDDFYYGYGFYTWCSFRDAFFFSFKLILVFFSIYNKYRF